MKHRARHRRRARFLGDFCSRTFRATRQNQLREARCPLEQDISHANLLRAAVESDKNPLFTPVARFNGHRADGSMRAYGIAASRGLLSQCLVASN